MPIECPIRPGADPAGDERRRREEARRQQERERARRAWEEAQARARARAREEARRQHEASSRVYMSSEDQAIALDLINAGYRAMSRKHHPDLGGSHEQMVAINKICDKLRNMISGKK